MKKCGESSKGCQVEANMKLSLLLVNSTRWVMRASHFFCNEVLATLNDITFQSIPEIVPVVTAEI